MLQGWLESYGAPCGGWLDGVHGQVNSPAGPRCWNGWCVVKEVPFWLLESERRICLFATLLWLEHRLVWGGGMEADMEAVLIPKRSNEPVLGQVLQDFAEPFTWA